MPRITAPLLFVAALSLALVGCSRPYVNIPPQTSDVAGHDPNARNVREIEIAALQAVLRTDPLVGPIAIVLPEGTGQLTYAAVLPAVSPDAVSASNTEAEPLSTVEVRQVRIRGWEGQVDIVRPNASGTRQLFTVHLEYAPFSGWSAKRIRPWRGPVDPLPAPAPVADEEG